jgi:hypothetical protein
MTFRRLPGLLDIVHRWFPFDKKKPRQEDRAGFGPFGLFEVARQTVSARAGK